MRRNIKIILLLLALVYISKKLFWYKWIGYESFPSTTQILDERNYAAAGFTFRKTGIPTAWSNLDSYFTLSNQKYHPFLRFDGLSITAENQKPGLGNYRFFNYPVSYVTDVNVGKGIETILIVQPFIDHSPLSGMVYSLGINNSPLKFDDIEPIDYRYPALILSFISGILLFFVGYKMFKSLIAGFAALLIYSTAPVYVYTSRLALTENLQTVFMLLTLLIILVYGENKKLRLVPFAAISAGLALLTKETGIAVILMGTFLFLFYKLEFKKLAFYFLIPSLVIGSLFHLYAFIISPQLFYEILINQAGRSFFGPLGLIQSVVMPQFKKFPIDGFWIWGVSSLFILAPSYKKHLALFIPVICTLGIFLIFAGANYPWYYLPFIPFLILASAFQIKEIVSEKNRVSLILFSLFAVSSAMFWGFAMPRGNNFLPVYRAFVLFITVFIIAVAFITKKSKNKKIAVIIWTVVVCAIFYQTYKWNTQSIKFQIANMATLPEQYQNP